MKKLKSPFIALVGIVLVLLATVKHSVLVYIEITQTPNQWYHYAYLTLMIISIDAAVIIFSVHGHKTASSIFALLIGIINLYFFWSPMTFPGWNFSGLIPFLPGLLYSGLFTAGLMMFTDIFLAQMEAETELSGLYSELETTRKELLETKGRLETTRKQAQSDDSGDRKLLETALDIIISLDSIGDKNPETLKRNLRNAKTRLKTPRISQEEQLQATIRALLYERAIEAQKQHQNDVVA